ncbi:MAG: hypothetical protein ACOCXA_06185, partial [Planctomycetota bacterium]
MSRLLSRCLPLLIPLVLPGAEQVIPFTRVKITESRPAATDPQAEVEFWLTDDNGASWRQLPDALVQRNQSGAPYIVFEAPSDGRFGLVMRLLPVDGQSDPVPSAGTEPRISLVVDTTAPELAAFSSFMERTDGDDYRLRCFWRVEDATGQAEGQSLQVSLDGSKWKDLASNLPLAGSWSQLVPSAELHVRLQARDAAGNQSTSNVHRPALLPEAPPPTRDQATETAPRLPDAILPSLDEVEQEAVATIAKLRAEMARPEVAEPAEPEEPTEPEAPAGPTPMQRLAELEPLQLRPGPPAEAKPDAVRVKGILERRAGRLLLGDDARTVLAAARSAATHGRSEQARALYERLHDSDQTAAAYPEQALLELRSGFPHRARALVDQAPPEAQG